MASIFENTDKSENKPTNQIDDNYISSIASKATATKKNPELLLAGLDKPQMPKPNMLQAILSGLAGGLGATQKMSPYATPEVAALTGALGGYGGYQQAEEMTIENAPMEQISPAIVEAIPAARGMSFKQFKELKDFFANQLKQQTQFSLETMKESGRMERAKGQPITEDNPMLDEYAKTLGVDRKMLLGRPEDKIAAMYGRIKTRQERVTYSSAMPILNEAGDTIGTYQVSSQGRLVSNPMTLAAGASQKEQDLNAVNDIMTDLFNTAKGFQPSSGPVQRVFGGLNWTAAQLGAAPEKKAYLDSIDSFLGNLSREYSGERGVLTDQDVARIKSAMPSLFDTDEEIEFKYKQIQRTIAQRMEAIRGGRAVVPGIEKKESAPKPTSKQSTGGGIKPGGFKKFMGK